MKAKISLLIVSLLLTACASNQRKSYTSDELFESFCNGEIDAESRSYFDDTIETMSANDFIFSDETADVDDVTLLVTKEVPVDLDNDGELEYILKNPLYGMLCFDCKDGKVVCFAQGEGTAAYCSYTKYDGAYWICYSDTTHSGRCIYDFLKFNGALEIVDSVSLYWEDRNDDGTKVFHKDGHVISENEFEKLRDDFFGY